jgi:hypothetical protein
MLPASATLAKITRNAVATMIGLFSFMVHLQCEWPLFDTMGVA